jgi:hypothetical protein
VSKSAVVVEGWENKTPSPVQIAEILRLHGAWLRGEADGARANLDGANLDGAYLAGANLAGANLARAYLAGANLAGANLARANLARANLAGAYLAGANLARAYLAGANLDGANLAGANLDGANLAGANLDGETRLPAGFAWKLYLSELVPALLTAGGKKLEEVANSETWGCHSWGSEGRELACPIATAFDVHQISDVPILYREQANFFIQVFDAKLVPLDAVLGKPAEVVAE